MTLTYNNRLFRSVQNSETGEVDAQTTFHYRQQDNVLWATYEGGAIRFGTLTGTVAAEGILDFCYSHVNQNGELMTGQCRSTPEVLADGRIRLNEEWQWTSGDQSSGKSIVEEIVQPAIEPAPIKETIPFQTLEQLDARVGTILSVEDVAKSDKLVKLSVDFGDHQRTILVGMKQERENPAEIVGSQALFVMNLDPRKMAGELSEGMLFDIGYADGVKPALAIPERPVPNGVRAG